jgi:hypothetical protein
MLSVGYNGYRQVQSDGKARVNDTTRVNRMMNSLYVSPSYTIDGDNLTHTFALTGNYTENKDLNRFATGLSDVKTMAFGLSHGLDIKAWEMNVSTSLSHQQSKGYQARYTSDVFSVGTSRSFLKEKNLYASANLSLCYNDIQNQQQVLSVGADLSTGYTLAQVHHFTLSAGFNKYSDTNISTDHSSMGTTEINISLGYNYTFSLLELKRKAEKKQEE